MNLMSLFKLGSDCRVGSVTLQGIQFTRSQMVFGDATLLALGRAKTSRLALR